MSIRIYALAKQLKVEHKTLVEICNRIGITGKGSALASLSDDEVAAIKAHLGAPKAKPSATGGAAAGLADRAPSGAGAYPPGALRREDYIAPAGTAPRKVPVLDRRLEKPSVVKKPAGDGQEAAAAPARVDKPEKAAPSIKLAPIPAVQQPPAAVKPLEPPPQKPDLRLPADVLRAGRVPSRPLSEHLRKQKERPAPAEKVSPKEPPGPAPQPTVEAPPLPPKEKEREREREKEREKDRGRRGVRVAAELDEEELGPTLGGREQRQLRRKRAALTQTRRGVAEEEEPARVAVRPPRGLRRTGTCTAAPRKSRVVVQLPCTVRSFSEALGVPAPRVMSKLLELGAPATITASVDPEVAELLAISLGIEVDLRQPVSLEERLLREAEREDDPAALRPRAPVVTFLGHVDHGKTSLLDRILGLDVAAHEKGGITQHIRAYRIEKDGRPIAFVDTPGHEAFTAMRARGAHCTDLVVLVVAADDGVMPQTEEAISHARAAGVPIIVALNKIDLPGANVQRVLQELAANNLLPSQWGGDTEVVQTSAVTGQGIDELLETVLTVAELREFRANPDRPACGVCLEAQVQQGLGVVAKVLVQKGTLRVGDVIVCGEAFGRIKAMYDTLNPRKRHKEAGPSTPVDLTGLDVPPAAGDRFYVLEDVSEARRVAQERAVRNRQQQLSGLRPHVTLENLFERLGQKTEKQTLHIILRADVRGSIEAIRQELTKLQHPEVQIEMLQASVGGITEADVHLADASDAVIIGFNVVPDEKARALAEHLGVQIRRYEIIYQVTEDLKAALEGMLKPEKREAELGRALVQRVFHISRVGTVAGCRVLAGTVQRDGRARVIRDSRILGDWPIESLRREKDDVREVREGMECGIKLGGFDDVKEGDILEVYRIEEVRRTF
ncbi:MAG: translation initiation factor IF-2 [Thermoguttaceae bacterium]